MEPRDLIGHARIVGRTAEETCRRCSGSGAVYLAVGTRWVRIDCRRCGGRGRL